MQLSLLICDPLTSRSSAANPTPRDQLLVDSSRASLRWTTLAPAGFGSLTVGLPQRKPRRGTGALPQSSALLDADCHVQLWAGSRLAFEGQVVQLSRGVHALPSGFVVEGYGISGVVDAALSSADSTAELSSGQLVAAAVATLSAYLQLDGNRFSDPGVSHVLSEFDFSSLADILGQVVKEGDGSGTIYDWFVWEGARLALLARTPPSTPDYHVPYDDRVSWDEDMRKRCSGVMLRYSLPGSSSAAQTLTVTNPDWSDARTRVVPLNGGTLAEAGARAFAQSYLMAHATPDVAITVSRDGLDGVPQPGGGERPLWLARAGEWVQLGDDPIFQMITRTDYDSASRTLSLKLGEYYADSSDLFGQVRAVTHAVKSGRNPLSGGKA